MQITHVLHIRFIDEITNIIEKIKFESIKVL